MKYIVFTNYINAWSIQKGLNEFGCSLHSVESGSKLLPYLPEEQVKDSDMLFFTEEGNLKKYIGSKGNTFYPREFPDELLDDKLLFARFLYDIGEKPVPSEKLQENESGFPIFLKCKHSWKAGKKLPRGFICRSEEDFRLYLNRIDEEGLDREWFFRQQLLTSPLDNNISVSGFFDYKDEKRNLMIVTKKALGDEEKIATGVAVETIHDPESLLERTKHILGEMQFTGPFEMEFFHEEADDEYYVLELNPRFWMQHGIFIDAYQNGLLKRYLGKDTADDWYENGVPEYQHIVWINNVFYWRAVMKRDKETVKKINGLTGKKLFYPDTPSTLKHLGTMMWKLLMKRNKAHA